ncbi:flagellar hook-basal body protein [Radiobacillus kanasensis]|uniref:flagellar hook-basal body protein n=1 Tax=Radiobacillus kanasensis TaxID=2844358 RepID=UPI001E5F78CB|nr:flagellar hook-basal body protein [Radiobacillus kanasensis]UFT98904.1 flagellar hook-basal body protein [Radiobacillus kanasensis]
MSRVGYQASVTMGQLQKKLDLIGHNMANANTSGYKSRQADFSSLLFQQIDNLNSPANAQGRLTPDGIRIGSGAALGHTNTNLQVGNVQTTGRALDVALLDESQWFQVNVTEGGATETRFTRSGAFYLSPINDTHVMLTNQDGQPLVGENGPIVLADGFDSIEITSTGQIQVTRNGQRQVEDQLSIVSITNPRLLEASGDNNFRLPDNAGINPAAIVQNLNPGEVQLKSGALESSNVDLANQMTELMTTQRAYQMNARSISMNDQMMGLVNQLR